MTAIPVLLTLAGLGGAFSGPLLDRILLVIALCVALAGLAVIGRPVDWYHRLTDRLLYGVPWGTLLLAAVLLAVYGGLQDGFGATKPIVLPFRAWSYLDPSGMLIAGLAHENTNHLVGNLLGTLLFGSVAESVWSHHPDRQTTTRLHAAWTHPAIRAIVIFPAMGVLLSVLGAVVALGPIIGFSIVVFAFAGFTLVNAPVATILASVSQGVLRRLLAAMQTPQQVAAAGTTYSSPWFASIAIQGHAVGLLFGVFIGLAYQRLGRRSRPTAGVLWTAVLLFAVERSLWAVYWYRGNNSYILYQAVGLGLVFVLATMVTYAVVADDTPIAPQYAAANPTTVIADLTTISSRQVGLLLLVTASALLIAPAVVTNATTAADSELPGEPIEVRGYELTYGENVTNGQLNVIDIEGGGESTRLNTSGVIVRNTDRHIWSTAVSKSGLANQGDAVIRLGGLTWQETVTASRTGWRAVGGDTTYRVTLRRDNRTRPLYDAPRVTAEPVIAGQRVSLDATDEGFRVGVGNELNDLPAQNESVRVARLTLRRQDGRLVAINNRTQTMVRVANKVG